MDVSLIPTTLLDLQVTVQTDTATTWAAVLDLANRAALVLAGSEIGDGGYGSNGGVYDVQVIAYSCEGEKLQKSMFGYLFGHCPGAQSAFQMELVALDIAVEVIRSACEA